MLRVQCAMLSTNLDFLMWYLAKCLGIGADPQGTGSENVLLLKRAWELIGHSSEGSRHTEAQSLVIVAYILPSVFYRWSEPNDCLWSTVQYIGGPRNRIEQRELHHSSRAEDICIFACRHLNW